MTLIKSISGLRGTIGGHVGEGLNPLDIVKFTSTGQDRPCRKQKQHLLAVIDRRIRYSAGIQTDDGHQKCRDHRIDPEHKHIIQGFIPFKRPFKLLSAAMIQLSEAERHSVGKRCDQLLEICNKQLKYRI